MAYKVGDILKVENKCFLVASLGNNEYYVWSMINSNSKEASYVLEARDYIPTNESKKLPLGIDLNYQLKVNSNSVQGKLGEANRSCLEKLWRRDFSKRAKEFYNLFHSPKLFIPGHSWISCSGKAYDGQEMSNLIDASLDFWLTNGRYASLLEEKLVAFLGAKYCLLTTSGSSANLLAVSALTSPKLGRRQLKPGDEVITVAAGFPTTITPIIQNRLVPVFVDVDLDTYNVNVEQLETAVSEKTRAIILAHTLGNPFNLDAVTKIARKYNLWLIEDNCDALGSTYKAKYTGTFGDLATLSFYPAHHITTGEGGAVITGDPLLKNIVESFRDWGRDCWCPPGHDNTCKRRFQRQLGSLPFGYDHKYTYSHLGYNLKLTDMQAAIGVAQMEKLPEFILSRKRNFQLLYEGLREYRDLFILPRATEHADPSWFGFLLTQRPEAPFTRQQLINHLEKHRIRTRLLFAGNITRQPAFQGVEYKVAGELKNTNIIMNKTFWIGLYPGLGKDEIRYILDTFNDFILRVSPEEDK
ncbi:MAG: lipopolysaccharide biosynthesis protein RfbH [Firmicutes bacterium]|nr:lipopolysaccharide biosynthesis protein RfbH [Bacillota bacterium]